MKYSLLKLSALAAIMNPAHAAFHKDALVTTPDGTRPISQLEVGHNVRSFSLRNETMNKAMVMAKSLGEQSKSIVEIDLGERTIKAMPNQRLFDVGNQDWVRAKDLTPNHILLGEDGSPINIVNVQKKRRTSFSLSHHVSVDEERNLFVGGVLCHNMDEIIAGASMGTEVVTKETIKKAVCASLTTAETAGLSVAAEIGLKMYGIVQKENEAIARGEIIPHDFNPTWAELNGLMAVPAVEVRPGGAPQPDAVSDKRRANQEKLERFRQANRAANKQHAHVVGPGASTGLPRAVVQVPSYQDPNWFENHDWVKHPIVKMGAFEMRQGGYRSPEEKAKDKRDADKQQMEGRAAAIHAADAKTEEERRAAVKSYDDWSRSLAAAPAPVIPKATPQEEEALKKMVPKEDSLASMFGFAMGYQHVHPQQAAAADAPRSFPMNQEILAMPPNIGIHVLTKAGYEAQNRVLSRMRERHEDNKRQLEEQQRIERQEGIEAAKKSEGAHKKKSADNARSFHQDIKKEHELLRDRLNAQKQAKRKK